MDKNDKKSKISVMLYLTLAYLFLIIIFALSDLQHMKDLKPNEWGDFFAGFFAPLAFLWLIFGYYQQGEELKQNTEALNLQAEELKNSVEQQKFLVETTQEELKLAIEQMNNQKRKELVQRQPFIHFNNVTISRTKPETLMGYKFLDSQYNELLINLRITNSRAIVRDCSIDIYDLSDGLNLLRYQINLFKTDENHTLKIKMPYPDCFTNDLLEMEIQFKYLDELDDKNSQIYIFQIIRDSSNFTFSYEFYILDKSY